MAEQSAPEPFEGHQPRECGEHRTVGPHRAWCFDCREWCYPDEEMACKGCRIPMLEHARDVAIDKAVTARKWAQAELGRSTANIQ
jgi:hypothetical protein